MCILLHSDLISCLWLQDNLSLCTVSEHGGTSSKQLPSPAFHLCMELLGVWKLASFKTVYLWHWRMLTLHSETTMLRWQIPLLNPLNLMSKCQTCSEALEHPAIAAVLEFAFGHKDLQPLGTTHDDIRVRLSRISMETVAFALTMVSGTVFEPQATCDWKQLPQDQICLEAIQRGLHCRSTSRILPFQLQWWLGSSRQDL